MNTFQQTTKDFTENDRSTTLLDVIAQWPDWKIQALCLDESDLKVKEAIQNRRLQRS